MALRHRLLSTLLLLAILPTAQAATFSFGTIVGKADWDYTPNPAGTTKLGLCSHDVNADGAYSPGEPLYLDISGAVEGASYCIGPTITGRPATDDIRIVPLNGNFAIGSLVVAGDADGPQMTYNLAPAHFLRYFDGQPDAKFKAKDTLYIDLFQVAAKTVSPGDVRLTAFDAFPAGSIVKDGDADANMPLTELSGAGITFTSDNAVYKAGSAYYVNTDGQLLATTTASTGYGRDFVVEENDVRLNAKAENPLGDFAAPTFIIGDASVLGAPKAGGLMQLKVIMKNTGKAPASALVETFMDDVLVDARGTATIAPGKEGYVVVTLPAPEDAGRAKLRVGKDTLVFYTVEDAVAGAVKAATSQTEGTVPATSLAPAAVQAEAKGSPSVPTLAILGVVGLLAILRRRIA